MKWKMAFWSAAAFIALAAGPQPETAWLALSLVLFVAAVIIHRKRWPQTEDDSEKDGSRLSS